MEIKQEVTVEKLTEALSGLFPGKNIVTERTRPAGQSKRTNNPYYKEKYALELLPALEEIDKTKKDVVFLYKNSPDLSKHSLYLKLNQAFRYVEDNLDFNPPNKFRNLRAMIHITREKDGIRFSFIRGKPAGSLIATQIISKDENIIWKDRMEDFFANSKPKDVFIQENLLLSADEIEELKNSTMELPDFICDIQTTYVKIIHLSTEL